MPLNAWIDDASECLHMTEFDLIRHCIHHEQLFSQAPQQILDISTEGQLFSN